MVQGCVDWLQLRTLGPTCLQALGIVSARNLQWGKILSRAGRFGPIILGGSIIQSQIISSVA